MNARLYDPLLGQFISVDPLADKYPGLSAYVYCANNPLRYIDPTGEAYVTIFENGKVVNSYEQSTEDFLSEWFDNPYHQQYIEDNWEFYDEDIITEFFSIIVENQISEGSDRKGDYTAYFHSVSVESSNYTFGAQSLGKVYDTGFDDPDRYSFETSLFYGDASNGGGNDWLDPTLNYSSKANGGLAAATGAREVLEWEYIRQARINRALSGNYSQTVKHSMKAIKAVGKFAGVASMGISWADYANNPTTGNLIQAIANTGLVFARVNPITGIIIGVADVTGISDYVYDQIGGLIDDF